VTPPRTLATGMQLDDDMESSPLVRASAAVCVMTVLGLMVTATSGAPRMAAEGVLDKLRAGAPLRLGFRLDARPFSYRDESGKPAGYSVTLCEKVLDALKGEPGLSGATAVWVPIPAADRFQVLERGQVDVFCGADTITPERQNQIAFSIPIFPGGIGALIRSESSSALKDVLMGRDKTANIASREAAIRELQLRAFTAVTKTTSETWLKSRIKDFGTSAFVMPVETFDTGVEQLMNNKTDAFFAERAMLLDAVRRHPSARSLAVVDRFYTQESLALSLPKGDDAWRQFANRALGKFYASGEVSNVYSTWFGPPDGPTQAFFKANTKSE